ncbi:hypothetical protein TW95_gp0423 [Pandoravirus inopinatum]|uniref:Uncharacterized protein n=1 Tax=Pandoravirus inopinatum TaxID=1605721 RepID=A0A0B5JC65_9VIRU|nr:hypothetical protein TW95_gp0423 [Pandoravirus inopinatum]AJF97157.1 hypothetical protein [Pandoravirus inopinatum]
MPKQKRKRNHNNNHNKKIQTQCVFSVFLFLFAVGGCSGGRACRVVFFFEGHRHAGAKICARKEQDDGKRLHLFFFGNDNNHTERSRRPAKLERHFLTTIGRSRVLVFFLV